MVKPCLSRVVCACLPALLVIVPDIGGQLVRVVNTTMEFPSSLPTASGYTTENALGSLTFSEPMVVTSISGDSDRLFVAEKGGTIQTVHNLSGTPEKTEFLALESIFGSGESLRNVHESGFLSVVFHPDFLENGRLFVYYSVDIPDPTNTVLFQRLHRITVADPQANQATILSHTPLLTIPDEAGNHNGGDLHFGPDGYLYLSLGDEGGAGDSFDNARHITQAYSPPWVTRPGFWGKMLRLDVDLRPGSLTPNQHVQSSSRFPSAVHAGTYAIPPDNPFIGATEWHGEAIDLNDVRTEIWATGFRNPFRWSFDMPTGRIFLIDVGERTYEEVNLVVSGGDYGWSWREGVHAFNSGPDPKTPPASGFNPIDPIFEYDHTNDGVGNDAVIHGLAGTGGMVYRGSRLTELYGAYIFADFLTGVIAAIREVDGNWVGERLALNTSISDFGADPRNGDLLFTDLASGAVKRLVRSGVSGESPPATLSELNAFSDLDLLTPQPGVVPYQPNVNFWSDHALKRRWFVLQDGDDQVGFHRDRNWEFPEGMAWIKHFDLETTRGDPDTVRKLETRLLVKTEDSVYGLSYRWREDQSDADLVAEEGMNETLSVLVDGFPREQVWHFPSRSECITCHTPVGGHALSFNTRQLSRRYTYGDLEQHQVEALAQAGYLSGVPGVVSDLPAYAAADDSSQSLEWRVRSYLAVNCAQCHQPGGTGNGSWDARATTATEFAGIVNGALLNDLGDSANRFVVPDSLEHSMVLKRLRGESVSRMPPLASNEIDQTAIGLLSAWIQQTLPDWQSFEDWRIEHFGLSLPPESEADRDPDMDGNDNRIEFLLGADPLVATDTWQAIVDVSSSSGQLSFVQPANRSVLIEGSTDMEAWSIWDQGPDWLGFPSESEERILIFEPEFESPLFLRVLLQRP